MIRHYGIVLRTACVKRRLTAAKWLRFCARISIEQMYQSGNGYSPHAKPMTLRHSNGIRIRSQLFGVSGLPLAEESINIRVSRSVALKARLYRVALLPSIDILSSIEVNRDTKDR